MTTNERLSATGLREEFDLAVSRRDKLSAVTLLERVGLDREGAKATADALFAGPSSYGYA